MQNISEKLITLSNDKLKEFVMKLIPTVSEEKILGITTNELKNYAKVLINSGEYKSFIKVLPHYYFEENQLHAFIISELSDFEEAILELERFLPYIDNWATCDQLILKSIKKY